MTICWACRNCGAQGLVWMHPSRGQGAAFDAMEDEHREISPDCLPDIAAPGLACAANPQSEIGRKEVPQRKRQR